jgi:hypothetical protein
VTVYAHQGSCGYGIIFVIILAFSMTFPGAVMSTSFLPGQRLVPLIGVSLLLLVACLSPFILLVQSIGYMVLGAVLLLLL